ncbi:YciI family protein [Natronospira bacteriovora]|uniref:YciI family protein n=1 Tax=Natronospira bacteriovora TaxID=3069753 RepID=A0ABU0W6S2_9GAMM|nr:YciI family protein [Natronospira sp. AB-CW4]MDQ2069160.1 YciI family protein [Natronospira sp. AB-CW4]
MWYVIVGHDQMDSMAARQEARPAHLARLKALLDEGRLLVAGPCPRDDAPAPGPSGISGSVIIAEFDSLESAREWADEDPYLAAGVYDSVEVRPFIKALP